MANKLAIFDLNELLKKSTTPPVEHVSPFMGRFNGFVFDISTGNATRTVEIDLSPNPELPKIIGHVILFELGNEIGAFTIESSIEHISKENAEKSIALILDSPSLGKLQLYIANDGDNLLGNYYSQENGKYRYYGPMYIERKE